MVLAVFRKVATHGRIDRAAERGGVTSRHVRVPIFASAFSARFVELPLPRVTSTSGDRCRRGVFALAAKQTRLCSRTIVVPRYRSCAPLLLGPPIGFPLIPPIAVLLPGSAEFPRFLAICQPARAFPRIINSSYSQMP